MKPINKLFSSSYRTVHLVLAAAAVILSLAGCSGKNTDPGSAGASAVPTASAVQSRQPAATETAAPASEQPVPAALIETDSLKSVFGFADETGKHILVTWEKDDQEQQMMALNSAIGNNGQLLTVKYEKWQDASDENNGRELAVNFANLSGYVFTVADGTAASDDTYYLADSALFNPGALLTIQPAAADTPQLAGTDPVRKSIIAVKQREIQSAWKLADLPPDRQLFLVQFVKQDKNMLFSLVLQEGDKLSFMDYPAVLQDNEYSVWRVDDGGEVIPGMFSLLLAAETADGLLLGVNWLGAEGVNTFFLSQSGEAFKELDIQYSRYTSPI